VWLNSGAFIAKKSVEYRKSTFMGAKLHIILYKKERFWQKVKIVTLFVKQ
jgi:hypothetical protein